jgi:phytoene dehydrogenase-like protein
MTDAVVVGAGPNGLAAAVAIARAGFEVTVLEAADTIGGGTRTEELLVPGVRHDICSAVHPFGAASPFLQTLDLERHGLRWRHAEVALAHPVDGGGAGVLHRSLDATVAGFDEDGPAWRRAFAPMAAAFAEVASEVFGPILHVPRHPVALARFGLRALQPATTFARHFRRDDVRGLFAGIAAHSFQPLGRPTTTAAGVMFVGAAHTTGWPVAEGGSRAITDALAALLVAHGGTIHTGVQVTSLAELPTHRVALLDVSPQAAAAMSGDRMPARVQRAYRRWKYGPGAFKVDLVVDGGVPWTNEACRRAGTVHCGGTLEEIAEAEAGLHRGRAAERPFVLVGQQHLADPSRSKGDLHPLWAYAHVPHGYTGDATEAIVAQIERFAPGLRERIVATSTRTPAEYERENANYVGGDIATGANSPWQSVVRPRLALDPYATGIPGVYLCSAATPPGAGVHGMCGANAAASALRHLAGNGARRG